METGAKSGAVAYVASHGGLMSSADKTFVPVGVRVVFHARPGSPMAMLAGARVVEILADQGQESFTGTANPLVMVPNYTLEGFGGLITALFAALADLGPQDQEEINRLYFVGDRLPGPTHLCTDPQVCLRNRRHRCDGVFGQLGATFGQIHFTCCRIVQGQLAKMPTEDVAGDDSDVLNTVDVTGDQFRKLIAVDGGDGLNVTEDPARLATAKAYFDNLDPKDQARLLIDSETTKNWFEIGVARRFLAEEGTWGLYVYSYSQDEATRDRILRSAPLRTQLTACSDTINDFDPSFPDDVVWFDNLSDRDRRWFAKTTDDIGTWVRHRTQQAALARARTILAGEAVFAPYLALITDDTLAQAAAGDPAIADRVEAINSTALAFLLWWADTATPDFDRRTAYNGLDETEQTALDQLIPDGLQALTGREDTYRQHWRALLGTGTGLGAYHELHTTGGLDTVRLHARTDHVLAELLTGIEATLTAWSNPDTPDHDRQRIWQACTDIDCHALRVLYPDITAAWEQNTRQS